MSGTIIPVSEETVERLVSDQYAKFNYKDGKTVALIPEAYREMMFRSFSPE